MSNTQVEFGSIGFKQTHSIELPEVIIRSTITYPRLSPTMLIDLLEYGHHWGACTNLQMEKFIPWLDEFCDPLLTDLRDQTLELLQTINPDGRVLKVKSYAQIGRFVISLSQCCFNVNSKE